MNISFHMFDDESYPTPIKVAEALIHKSGLSELELEELGQYLIMHTRFYQRKKLAIQQEEVS